MNVAAGKEDAEKGPSAPTSNELKDSHWLFDTPGIAKERDVSAASPIGRLPPERDQRRAAVRRSSACSANGKCEPWFPRGPSFLARLS